MYQLITLYPTQITYEVDAIVVRLIDFVTWRLLLRNRYQHIDSSPSFSMSIWALIRKYVICVLMCCMSKQLYKVLTLDITTFSRNDEVITYTYPPPHPFSLLSLQNQMIALQLKEGKKVELTPPPPAVALCHWMTLEWQRGLAGVDDKRNMWNEFLSEHNDSLWNVWNTDALFLHIVRHRSCRTICSSQGRSCESSHFFVLILPFPFNFCVKTFWTVHWEKQDVSASVLNQTNECTSTEPDRREKKKSAVF